MKCYTRQGDLGTCNLKGLTEKSDARVEALGDVDELNAFLGAAAVSTSNETIRKTLYEVQNDMFSIGAELALMRKAVISAKHVERMEMLIDKISEQLSTQDRFIIPTGTQSGTMLNVARTVARRAERSIVKLDRDSKVNEEVLKYANRLSSLLYVLYRLDNSKNKVEEKNPVYNK